MSRVGFFHKKNMFPPKKVSPWGFGFLPNVAILAKAGYSVAPSPSLPVAPGYDEV